MVGMDRSSGGQGAQAKKGYAHPLKRARKGLGLSVGGEELKGGVNGTHGLKNGSRCYGPRGGAGSNLGELVGQPLGPHGMPCHHMLGPRDEPYAPLPRRAQEEVGRDTPCPPLSAAINCPGDEGLEGTGDMAWDLSKLRIKEELAEGIARYPKGPPKG